MHEKAKETFLVTGAMGCLGAWVLYHLVQQGWRAVGFDLSEDRRRLHLLMPPEAQEVITFARGDLTNVDAVQRVFREEAVTHVIHLAALQVPFCKADPALGAQVNVVGTINVFEAARQAGVPHLAYASSVAVYGPADAYPAGPVSDEAIPAPRTLYGVYKVANEGTARVYWADYGLSSTALRPYTIYGVGRDQGLTSDPTKAMLAAAAGAPFHIGFGGAMQFQWASDVARQFIDAALHPLDGAWAFMMDTPSATVADLVAAIHQVKPQARITHSDVLLPFPARFEGAAYRKHLPSILDTPLVDGVRATIEQFEACLRDGRLTVPSAAAPPA